MKNPMEVLRAKEQEMVRVQNEIEALRVAAQLLGDESEEARNQAHAGPASQANWRVPRDSSTS